MSESWVNNIGVFSYAAGAVLYAIFALLLLTSWRGKRQGGLFVGVVVFSAIWCGLLAINNYGQPFSLGAIFVLEAGRYLGWQLFLVSLLSGQASLLAMREQTLPRFVLFNAVAAVLVAVLLLAGMLNNAEGQPQTVVPFTVLLIMTLAGLVLVEQIYRNTPDTQRWSIKFLCIGVGALFAYDLYQYSHGLLFRRLGLDIWNARGVVNALTIPLIAVAVARNPQWSLNIFVSRQVVFYSTTLIGAGVYLLAMALSGYYIRLYGGDWGAVAQIIFLFGAAIVLALIMFSSQAKTTLRVFLAKHFFSNKYDYRVEWLRLIDILSTPTDNMSLQQRAIKGLVRICNARGGGIWQLNDMGKYEVVSDWNMQRPHHAGVTADDPFIKFMTEKKWIVNVLEDCQEGCALPEWFEQFESAWLIVPLIHEESLFGFMVLEHAGNPRKITWEDTDLLKTVGRQVASYLAFDNAAEQLLQGKQFDAYNKLAAFVIHDIKNLVSQLSLVTQNAVQHMNNPLFVKDAMQTIDNCVNKMNDLLRQLQKNSQGLIAKETVIFDEFVEQIAAECAGRSPVPDVKLGCKSVELLAEKDRLGMMLRHLISNAQDATPPDGEIIVTTSFTQGKVSLLVKDNGCGMSEEFVQKRLFRPFDSTKENKGMGVGAFEVKEYIHSIGGAIAVNSKLGDGTEFLISLPLEQKHLLEKSTEKIEVAHVS